MNTIMEALDIKQEELTPDRVVFSMPVTGKTKQPMGYLHGGASVVLAETAASVGTILNIDQTKQSAFGIEINANHIKSKRDGIVKAIATPFHKGKRTMIWDIKIIDENEDLICISRCTVGVVDRSQDRS